MTAAADIKRAKDERVDIIKQLSETMKIRIWAVEQAVKMAGCGTNFDFDVVVQFIYKFATKAD